MPHLPILTHQLNLFKQFFLASLRIIYLDRLFWLVALGKFEYFPIAALNFLLLQLQVKFAVQHQVCEAHDAPP